MVEKLERLNEDLETMMKEKRSTNPIVGNVLAIAAKAMGLAKCENEDLDNNPAADFVSDILKWVLVFKPNYIVKNPLELMLNILKIQI